MFKSPDKRSAKVSTMTLNAEEFDYDSNGVSQVPPSLFCKKLGISVRQKITTMKPAKKFEPRKSIRVSSFWPSKVAMRKNLKNRQLKTEASPVSITIKSPRAIEVKNDLALTDPTTEDPPVV
jgi:hypothetical protein